jgi:SsrA-binding protein
VETQQQGLTLVPLSIYFRGTKAKIELGLAKGKKLYDKRHDIAKRESDRQIERESFRRR